MPLFVASVDVSAQIRVMLADEHRIEQLDGFVQAGVLYASASGLADLLKLRTYFNESNQKLVLYTGAHSIKLTADNPFIQIDDKLYQMPLAVQQKYQTVYVPLLLFLKLTSGYFPGEISFDSQSEELHLRRNFFNVTGIDVESRSNGHIIRLSTGKKFDKKDVEVALNRDWLNVTFIGGTVDTLALKSNARRGIVKRSAAFQYDKAAQISFQLSDKIVIPELFVNDSEVLISLREDKSSPPTMSEVLPTAVIDKKRWLFDTIILDPGHGGRDPGTPKRSRNMHEKDVTLDLAKRLKSLLENHLGVKVLMTRTSDKYIDLTDRTKFANRNHGKLFVSIHCNANNSPSARGFSVFAMGKSKTKEAQRVAEAENSVAEDMDDFKEFESTAHILNVIARNSYLKESLDLGQMMVDNVCRNTKIPKLGKGVFQARFLVLWRAAMPSVLVETAMMSNRYEEKLLNTKGERRKIARALYDAIAKFIKKYEQGIK
ncbi:N-acetylmuramoyl-L-alanine amidase [bacterium]|nr:N-acetylmuramoyl-L-alanine amidase [bacterium]